MLSGLCVGEDPPIVNDPEDPDGEMLLFHHYTRQEAIPSDDKALGANIRLKRLTIDILLPGPTTTDQIKAVISDDGRTCHFTYRPPATYLSPNCTVVRLAGTAFGDRGVSIADLCNTMGAATRVQAHRTKLETIRLEQHEKVRHISLPFEVDRAFCRRDDWGRDNATHGMEIGMYRHENPVMQANNQFVWILHIELSARERPITDPLSPGGFGDWSRYA